MIDWSNTSWVKLYRVSRWSSWFLYVSLEARGLFDELLKVVDHRGMLPLGRSVPADRVAQAVNGHPDRVRGYLDELLDEGAVVVGTAGGERMLCLRHYVAGQEARTAPRVRQSESRERQRLIADESRQLSLGVTRNTEASRERANCDTLVRSAAIPSRSRIEDNKRETSRARDLTTTEPEALPAPAADPIPPECQEMIRRLCDRTSLHESASEWSEQEYSLRREALQQQAHARMKGKEP